MEFFFISTGLIAVLGTFDIVENIIQKQCTYNVSFGLSIFLLHLVSPVSFFQYQYNNTELTISKNQTRQCNYFP